MDTQDNIRILFVCSILGARAYVAKHFVEQYSNNGVTAVAAGFEQDTFGPKIRIFLEEKGILLPKSSPTTVFRRHQNNESYDYIITLCNDAAREQCPIFRISVNSLFSEPKMLHWHIADFQSVIGDQDFIKKHWNAIVNDIESHAKKLITGELKLPLSTV